MRIAIFSSGYNSFQLRLQPWLTLCKVGTYLRSAGHEVWIATDGKRDETLPIPTKHFRSLRGTESVAITSWLKEFSPDRTVVSVSPFSLATAVWYTELDPRTSWAFLPYALYNFHEMASGWRHLSLAERWGYGRNLLFPEKVWKKRIRRHFKSVLCQSHRTACRLGPEVTSKVIPPGLDIAYWHPDDYLDLHTTEKQRTYLYMGSLKAIRGFDVLLEAMKILPAEICLHVLARGLVEQEEMQLKARLEKIGLSSRVRVRSGWLSPKEIREELKHVAAVVLPFVLVPSEMPVSVMEVIACGTPVIVSDIDGLPEFSGEAGTSVPPGNPDALAETMKLLAMDEVKQQDLRRACVVQRQKYLDWTTVAKRWAVMLNVHP